MSRYRRNDPDLAYGGLPPERWDSSRYQSERQQRRAPVIEQRPPYEEYRGAPPPPRRAPYWDDQRYYEDDRYGPRGSVERRFYEEEEFYDPRAVQGAMVPFRPERPSRPQAPPRPGLLRRQSSLDTFDRRPPRRYHEEYRPPPPAPPPRAPSPRRPSRYEDRYYDDVRIQDPDYYGDEGFREYREREWVRNRRDSPPRAPSRSPSPAPSRRAETVAEEKIERVETRTETKTVEKPYPRRGKTRMPKRLVHTKVLFDLGYSFYEEDEKTILIEKALGPDNIDEVFAKSKEYRERETTSATTTTKYIEAPPPAPPAPASVAPSRPTAAEQRILEEIKTKSISEAPRSVREWDALTPRRSPSPSAKSTRSKSTRRSRSKHRRRASSATRETVIERKSTVVDRGPSPARTARTSTTRRRGTSISSDEEIIRRRVVETDDYDHADGSNSVHVGPLALVVDRSKSRSDRDIQGEIRRLEAERRALRRERRHDRDSEIEIVKVDRGPRERSPSRVEFREASPRREIVVERVERRDVSPERQIIIDRRDASPRREVVLERGRDEFVETRRERTRSRSRPAPPSAGLIRSMMYTAT